MFRWKEHASRSGSLWHSNRARLCFENLETRNLLSGGVIHQGILDNPAALTAIVMADHAHTGTTFANDARSLSDVVALDGSTKVLSHSNQFLREDRIPEPLDVQSFRQFNPLARLEQEMTSLLQRELAFLANWLNLENSLLNGGVSETTDMAPTLNTGNVSGTTAGVGQPGAVTAPSAQPLTLQLTPGLQVRVIEMIPGSNDFRVQVNDPGTAGDPAAGNPANPGPVQTPANPNAGPVSNGRGSSAGSNANGSHAVTTNTSGNGTTSSGSTPAATTNAPADAVRGAADNTRTAPAATATGPTVVAPVVPQANVPTQTAPATTTPTTPAQAVQAQAVEFVNPAAPFERIILTKEGYKNASGEEQPANRRDGRADRRAMEQEDLSLLDEVEDGSVTEAALLRRKSDAFFTDPAALEAATGDLFGQTSKALAGAALLFGGFYGAAKKDDRKRRQSGLASLWRRFRG